MAPHTPDFGVSCMNSGYPTRGQNSGYQPELARSQQGPRIDVAKQLNKREASARHLSTSHFQTSSASTASAQAQLMASCIHISLQPGGRIAVQLAAAKKGELGETAGRTGSSRGSEVAIACFLTTDQRSGRRKS
jgi:hypothetical protein